MSPTVMNTSLHPHEPNRIISTSRPGSDRLIRIITPIRVAHLKGRQRSTVDP